MLLIVSGFLLMLAGLLLLFAVVAGFISGGAWLAIFAFAVSLAGMVMGLGGIGRRLQKPPRPRNR